MVNNAQETLCQSPIRTQWQGVWIWPEDVAAARNVYAQFRRPFVCTTAGVLEISITADSHYLLYVDGKFITRGPMRAPLDYYGFDTLTLSVEAGEHCLAVLVHHVGEINATMMLGRPALLVDARVRVGEMSQILSTDAIWQCRLSDAWRHDLPSMMSHFGFWEDCNLSHLPENWTICATDTGDWHAPAIIGAPPCTPWTRLLARDIALPTYTPFPVQQIVGMGQWEEGGGVSDIPSVQVARRQRSQQVVTTAALTYQLTSISSGRYLTVDFGRTISGYVELAFTESQVGQHLDMSYDELLTPDNAVNPERSYAHATDRYHLPNGPFVLRTTHPRGFRYVTLDLYGQGSLSLQHITAIEETYPFRLQGSFIAQHTALASYYVKAAETVRICTTDAFTDCPTRERVQWMEDMYMHCRVAAYAFGDTNMLRHALYQGAQTALPDGRINGFFPTDRNNLAFASASLLWLHLLVDYWLCAGKQDIQQLLPTASRLLQYCAEMSGEDELLQRWSAQQFWEWAPIESDGCLLLTNAVYIWALARISEHKVFSSIPECQHLTEHIASLRQAAHMRFWDAERGLYRDAVPEAGRTPIYSQQANSLAVLAGICPAEARIALLQRIIDPTRLSTIPIGEHTLRVDNRPSPDEIVQVGTLWFAHFVCQALFEAGMNTEAIAQIQMFWGGYDHLATFPETRIQHGNTGHCHGWASGPAYLLPGYVLGIQSLDAGWSTVSITPHPGSLSVAQGSVMTPLGCLSVRWECQEGGRVIIQVDAPEAMQIRFATQQT